MLYDSATAPASAFVAGGAGVGGVVGGSGRSEMCRQSKRPPAGPNGGDANQNRRIDGPPMLRAEDPTDDHPDERAGRYGYQIDQLAQVVAAAPRAALRLDGDEAHGGSER